MRGDQFARLIRRSGFGELGVAVSRCEVTGAARL